MWTEKTPRKSKKQLVCVSSLSQSVHHVGVRRDGRTRAWTGEKREDRFGKNGKRQSNPHSKICLILTQCCSFLHLFLSLFVWLFSCALLIIFTSFSHLLLWFCSVSFPPLLFVFFMGEVCLFSETSLVSSMPHLSSSLLWFVINPLFCLRLSPEGFARNPLITLCLLKPLKN